MRRIVWIAGGAVAVLAIYLVIASVGLALGLGAMLTPGVIDWSGANRPAPADPIEIGYRGDPKAAFGWDFETVHYPTELGEAEAWVIPAAEPSPLWAIFVHGIGGIRENGYRMAKILHEAGVTVMMITYRNDRGGPAASPPLYSFGLTEWPDLEAAVEWTAAQGAGRVIIVAESMGAGVTGQYLARAADTSRVAGLVLDAPALDFPAVIHHGGRQYWVPLADLVAEAGMWLSSLMRTDLRPAVVIDAVAGFDGPIFIAHGRRDPLVPFSISEKLVALRPDAILVASDADTHPRSYFSDPEGYRAGLLKLVEAVRATL
jgi:pimeloyl-ACP methyl ester carboxylesterase